MPAAEVKARSGRSRPRLSRETGRQLEADPVEEDLDVWIVGLVVPLVHSVRLAAHRVVAGGHAPDGGHPRGEPAEGEATEGEPTEGEQPRRESSETDGADRESAECDASGAHPADRDPADRAGTQGEPAAGDT